MDEESMIQGMADERDWHDRMLEDIIHNDDVFWE
jgi:hypothetical protein